MANVLAIVPDSLRVRGAQSIPYRKPVIRFRLPTSRAVTAGMPVEEWPVVEIPCEAAEPAFGEERAVFPDVDGNAVDASAVWAQYAGTWFVSLPPDAILNCEYPDGGAGTASCRDVLDSFAAYMECWYRARENLSPEDKLAVYQSCFNDYQDEPPYVRTVRAVDRGITPLTDPDSYRTARLQYRDYSGFPAESGFVKLSHTVLRKDLISKGTEDVGGHKCRRVLVPSAENFLDPDSGPDDRSAYQEVYVPVEYFWNLSDADVPDSCRARADTYAVCTIPDDGGLYSADGSRSHIDARDFSAYLTCLTSCQLCRDNLMFDPARFDRLYERVAASESGGALWSRIELVDNVPAVDFTENVDGEFERPSAEAQAAVRRRVSEYHKAASLRQAAANPVPPDRHAERLSGRVGREHVKSVFLAGIRNFDLSQATSRHLPEELLQDLGEEHPEGTFVDEGAAAVPGDSIPADSFADGFSGGDVPARDTSDLEAAIEELGEDGFGASPGPVDFYMDDGF